LLAVVAVVRNVEVVAALEDMFIHPHFLY